MKKFLVILGALVLGVGLCSISYAAVGITGSAHDFQTKGWNPSGEICIVCHTPHKADTTVTSSPLWNHEVTTTTYTLYTSGTLTATLGQPDGVSKLCLSCHDGTVALDNYGGVTGGTNFIGAGKQVTTGAGNNDLSGSHPVSFVYNSALATSDGGLYDPSTQSSGLPSGGTITADMLFSDKLECASCHDVHNSSGVAKLLVKSNAASALCLTCHNK